MASAAVGVVPDDVDSPNPAEYGMSFDEDSGTAVPDQHHPQRRGLPRVNQDRPSAEMVAMLMGDMAKPRDAPPSLSPQSMNVAHMLSSTGRIGTDQGWSLPGLVATEAIPGAEMSLVRDYGREHPTVPDTHRSKRRRTQFSGLGDDHSIFTQPTVWKPGMSANAPNSVHYASSFTPLQMFSQLPAKQIMGSEFSRAEHQDGSVGSSSATALDTLTVSDVLQITEQPTEHGRFRYPKEGRRTALTGRSDGSYPTVALTAAFSNKIPDGTMIQPTIVSRHDDVNGNPLPHWHKLEGKHGGSAAVPLKNGTAVFHNLVVNRNPKKLETKPHTREDQQIIRLMFTILFRMDGMLFRSGTVTDCIYGTELKISSTSHRFVSAADGGDITLLTSKIVKKNTALKIFDPCPAAWGPTDGNGWTLEDGCPTFVLGGQKDDLYIHHQYALVAKLPPFWDATIQTPRTVHIQLMDTVQKLSSESIEIEYRPST